MQLTKYIVALLLVLAPAASALAGIFGSSWAEMRDSANACFDAIDDQAEFRALNLKLPPGKPTIDNLADESLPNDSELGALRNRASLAASCREKMLSAMREHHPYLLPALELRYFQVDLVYVQLMQRRITFGNANRLIEQSYLEFAAREAEYDRARNDEQRRALADSMRDLSRQAQSSPPPSGTGRMTCRWIGPTLYCDSY
jgi:hypothetical protein